VQFIAIKYNGLKQKVWRSVTKIRGKWSVKFSVKIIYSGNTDAIHTAQLYHVRLKEAAMFAHCNHLLIICLSKFCEKVLVIINNIIKVLKYSRDDYSYQDGQTWEYGEIWKHKIIKIIRTNAETRVMAFHANYPDCVRRWFSG